MIVISKPIVTFCQKKLIDRGYKKAEIYDSISKIFDRNREDLLTQKNERKYRIPLILTYNRTLTNVKETARKYWNILQINNEFKNVFPELSIMRFRRNKNLEDVLWTKTIANNKAQKIILSNRKGNSTPCHSKTENLCCKKVKHTNTLSSTVTKKTCNIYNKLNCKSRYLIYLMECTLQILFIGCTTRFYIRPHFVQYRHKGLFFVY